MGYDRTKAAALVRAVQAVSLPDVCGEEDFARALRVRLRDVQRIVLEGGVPGRVLNGRWYCSRRALLAFLERGTGVRS